MTRPRVALINGAWTYTFRSSDSGLMQTNIVASLVIAGRRAQRVAYRQGRVL